MTTASELREHEKSPFRSGWAKGGSLVTGQLGNQVTMQAVFGGPSQFTVQIDVEQVANAVQCQAAISLVVDGVPITRVIDVAAGASISGVAESVRVVVTDVPVTSAPAGTKYGVTITVGKYARPGGASPVRNGFTNTPILSGGSKSVAVPPGAVGVIVFGTVSAGGGAPDLAITQLTGATGTGPHVLLNSQVTVGEVTPIIGGAQTVSITNNGGASADVSVIFTIDG